MLLKWFTRGIQRPFGTRLAYEVSVGAVVFRQRDGKRRYLLLQYPYGYWDYVKGHVEGDETYQETLTRETREESGLELRSIMEHFHKKSRYFYTAKSRERERRIREGRGLWIFKTVHFFLAEAKDGQVRISHEHIDSAWFSFDEAMDRLVFPRSKDILASAEEYLADRR